MRHLHMTVRSFTLLLAFGASAAGAAAQDAPYFQQGVDYRIEATLDEPHEVLRGRARLRYTNHSGATLDTLFVHQHLNAFRPNSAWATRELKFGEDRFQKLGPEEHGFERFSSVRVDGTAVTPLYPGAPDSTVVALPLPRPLAPGASTDVVMDWTARPSTTPRRQGRRGRHYDFAQWYPRIAVYDRGGWEQHQLMPQGEFYGEFASYDVTLDVAQDQVIGATGVPVEGDPGWAAAAATPNEEVDYRRDVYGDVAPAESLGLLEGGPAAGRKRVRWIARDVPHFAWSTSPDYVYEGGSYDGGRYGDVAIHVLYQPGDTAWDDHVAVDNSRTALAWYDSLYGPFQWPQFTNLHRIEGGGTEFPMMVMNGGASLGLILHEGGHQYSYGQLHNNQWKQGWLDEGMASFTTDWYFADHGQPDVWNRTMAGIGGWEGAGRGLGQPLDLEAAAYSDFRTYNVVTYGKGEAVLEMLRQYLGDATMRRVMRAYFDEFKLHHVRVADFQNVAERVSGQELGWFFDQWVRRDARLDYGVGDVSVARAGNGWVTTVEVLRLGDAWMPVTLEVGDVTRRLTSKDRRQVVEVRTDARPAAVTLDPDLALIDMDRENNRVELGS